MGPDLGIRTVLALCGAASSHSKFLPVVPCVVGYTYESEEKKARIFCWDKTSQKIQLLDGEMEFEKFNSEES